MAGRPRILIFVKGLGIGGAEKLLSEGARFWDVDAFDYRVAYMLPWKNQLVPDIVDRGFTVDCYGDSWVDSSRRLRAVVRQWRPDLIHAHLPMAGILARVATSVPVVYTEHNVASSYHPATRVANIMTYWRNAATIAVSDAVAASLRRYPGPDPVVIPNGVAVSIDPEASERVRRELAIDAGRPLVVHVGNIRPWKGHRTLIEAVGHLVKQRPDVVVASIGVEKHPGDLVRLRAEAGELGVGGTIRFLGRRPDAIDFIAAADVFVNPSDVEGLPLVVLEAMAAGTPVVATSVGGVPSVVRNGETGLLVAPGSPMSLAGAMAELIGDGDYGDRLGNRAQALAADRYGLERMVRATEEVYRGAVG